MTVDLGTAPTVVEYKFNDAKEPGYFEGHGAVFNSVDRGGDLIETGAFAKSLSQMTAGGFGLPSMYYNHDRKAGTVGVWTHMAEDSTGLAVAGKLIGRDTDFGKMNEARLREGAMKGLSIGYRVAPYGSRKGSGATGAPARILKQLDLVEVSVVDDPMNPLARINFIKSVGATASPADEIKTIREFEDFLRDAGGFSRQAAKAIAAGGFKAKPDPRDEDGIGDQIRARLDALATLIRK